MQRDLIKNSLSSDIELQKSCQFINFRFTMLKIEMNRVDFQTDISLKIPLSLENTFTKAVLKLRWHCPPTTDWWQTSMLTSLRQFLRDVGSERWFVSPRKLNTLKARQQMLSLRKLHYMVDQLRDPESIATLGSSEIGEQRWHLHLEMAIHSPNMFVFLLRIKVMYFNQSLPNTRQSLPQTSCHNGRSKFAQAECLK